MKFMKFIWNPLLCCSNLIVAILVWTTSFAIITDGVCSVLVEDFRANHNYVLKLWFKSWNETIKSIRNSCVARGGVAKCMLMLFIPFLLLSNTWEARNIDVLLCLLFSLKLLRMLGCFQSVYVSQFIDAIMIYLYMLVDI